MHVQNVQFSLLVRYKQFVRFVRLLRRIQTQYFSARRDVGDYDVAWEEVSWFFHMVGAGYFGKSLRRLLLRS